MNRPVSIEKTFEAIRQLPAEIAFQNVELFVLQQTVIPVNNFSWLNLKNMMNMLVVTSALTIVVILTRPANHPLTVSQPETSESIPVISQPAIEPLPQGATFQEQKIKKEDVMIPLPNDSPGLESGKERIEELKAEAITKPYPASIINNPQAPINEDDRIRIASPCNCDCNFGEDNGWIKEIVKELINEKLISDECVYQFKLTGNSITVNGKHIEDPQFAARLNALYKNDRGERLNDISSISVKVTKETCSLSKNIEN